MRRRSLAIGLCVLLMCSVFIPMSIGYNIRIFNISKKSTMIGNNINPPEEEWNRTFGGLNKDAGFDVIQSNDGGFILAGVTGSFGFGNDDVWLIKTDVLGNEEWNKTYGSTRFEGARSIIQASDGCLTILGITSSYGAGGWDFWLLKTDVNGSELWNCTYGGAKTDYAYSLHQTVDGGYILIGYTDSFGAGWYDVWLVKTDKDGTEQWNKTYGSSDLEEAWSGEVTSDGGFIITGYAKIDDNSSLFVIKTDSLGNEEWNMTYNEGGYFSYGASVLESMDGGYVVCGAKGNNLFSSDILLIRLDEYGNEIWNRTILTLNDDWGWSIRQTKDGGYIISGEMRYVSGYDYTNVLLLKTNNNGNEQWNMTFNRTLNNRGRAVKHTIEGGFIIIGESDFHGLEAGNMWLIKVARENHPPATPKIIGPTHGKVGIKYYYTFNSSDSDGDDFMYILSWGDGSPPEVVSPSPSGEGVACHIWYKSGNYIITAYAEDANGVKSGYGLLEVTMPRTKTSYNSYLSRFLEMFPILWRLLEFIR